MTAITGANRQLRVSRVESVAVGLGGVVALFGVYWDDAWHTDVGRDSALEPPHLVLYAGVALVGLAVAVWGLRVLARTRSLTKTLRYRPLLFAGLGATAILASAPLDAFWHSVYGRDAVLWSPPHIITVFASAVMIIGVLSGIDDRGWPLLGEVLACLILGNLAVAVMEYETDVPQFSDVYYLPIAVCAGLLAAWLARSLTGHRYAVTIMVLGYLAVRLVITTVLILMGPPTAPDLPIAYLGLLAIDLPVWRTAAQRYAAGAAGMAALAVLAATFDLASQSPALLMPTVIAAVAVLAAAVSVGRRRRNAVPAVMLVLAATASLPFWPATPAAAHDPGQGEVLRPVDITVTSDGAGAVTLVVEASDDCADLEPVRLVARRGGQTRTAPLRQPDACRYESVVHLPGRGRWFVYAELRAAGDMVEVWLPVRVHRRESSVAHRSLYRPSGSDGITGTEAATGVAVYLVGIVLLGSALWQVRRRGGRRDHEVVAADSGHEALR